MGDGRYLYQIVFCSEPRGEGRAFRREITIYSTGSFVTGIEVLPPGYEFPMAMMRAPDEPVYATADHPDGGGHNCPFCGNPTIYYCGCGAISCCRGGRPTHQCPRCGVAVRPQTATHTRMSKSGLLSGGPPVVADGRREDRRDDRRVADPQTQARQIARNADLGERLRRLEGKTEASLPPALPPGANKALPAPETPPPANSPDDDPLALKEDWFRERDWFDKVLHDGTIDQVERSRRIKAGLAEENRRGIRPPGAVRLKPPKETWVDRLAGKISGRAGEPPEKGGDERLRDFMKKRRKN